MAQPGAENFEAYAERWLSSRRVNGRPLAPKTIELYTILLDVHIFPTFAAIELGEVRTEAIRLWLATFESPMTAAKCYRLLRGILATAVEDERIATNPCRIKGAGVERSPERPIVGPEVVLALADAITPKFRCLVLLAGFGGLRLGELRALRRRHLDFEAQTVTVAEQVVTLRGQRDLLTEPKSRAGRRTIALPEFVIGELVGHMGRLSDNEDSLLFTEQSGGFLRPATLYRHWRSARTACGQPELHIHDLRHAAGTLAAWTGATQRELMARLGHSSAQTAMRYQHASADRDRMIAAGIDALITGAGPPSSSGK